MQEVEVKILEIDRAEVEAKLVALGATVSFDGEMHAVFYDDPEGGITKSGGVLRLRKEGDETKLTFKRHVAKGGAKIMEETETGVDDLIAMQVILANLGYKVTKNTRKFRRQYDLPDGHVVIDDYQDRLGDIPVFLEIEATDEETVFAIAAQLGYAPNDCRNWNTYDLVKHYLEPVSQD